MMQKAFLYSEVGQAIQPDLLSSGSSRLKGPETGKAAQRGQDRPPHKHG
jgi:hypothetical protein